MAMKRMTPKEVERYMRYMTEHMPSDMDPETILVEKMAQVILAMGDKLAKEDECPVDADGCLTDNDGDAETDMEPCAHCLKRDCECSDADVDPNMGDN